MIWFNFMNPHVFFIILLLCPKTTILATSLGNQLAAAAGGGGDAVTKCFHKEKQALLDFKARLEDPDGQLSTWRLEDDDCCKWSGVTCNNQTRHVTKLQLLPPYVFIPLPYDSHKVFSFRDHGRLRGEISDSLVNLSYLNHLDLSSNSFDGTIPNFIGSMTQLRYLALSSNYFNGTIPNFIGSMTQLRYLDLSFNYFQGTIPKSIGSLTQLRYLDLSKNFFLFGAIPPEFGNLTNLQNLSLGVGHASLTTETLDWLSNLSHLQHLEMDKISLAKANHWVDAILSLQKLSYLRLSRCDLSEIMHPYSSLVNYSSSIEFLSFWDNNLNPSMYSWLFPLTSNRLCYLDLSMNNLDRIPKYLGSLCSLTALSFSSNSAVVNLSDFLNNLSGCTSVALQELYAWDSQFIGSLSDKIHEFSSLKTLDFHNNSLNGTMSEKVWELPNLEMLDVSSNSLRGGGIVENIGKSKFVYIDLSKNSLELIPSEAHILNLSYVEYIDLSGCMLGPLFPKWIQTPKNLTHLDIANTRISDTIPVEFWKIWPSRLTYLNLSSNNISGEVSDLSSNFGLYSEIDLSSNKFYGSIPNVPPTLISLNLSKNKFYGGISFLCQIVDGFLSFLDLSHNSLTGELPDCLWHFKELQVLNLGHNKLSGRLPASIGYLARLEVLHLYNNNFSGELSLALKNCTKLKFLNLGANKFLGNVPVWVGESLTFLYALSLKSNNFFGPIPLQLCHLMHLQILDLSVNNLNGTIPSCVNNLNAMVLGRSLWRLDKHDYQRTTKDGWSFRVGTYVDNAMIEWQGNEHEFTRNVGLLMSIDLSSNNLTGKIPNELTDLHKLLALNLSKNALHGEIPQKIGEMKELLTLDLSRNTFSGGIPSSMSQMTSLNYLDMSDNNLSGRIPSSTQLQSFEPSRYTGNVGLCGPPLTKNCLGDEVPPVASKSESGQGGTDELERWFYIGGGTGFATGFWIACGGLLLNRHGRYAFFNFLDFWKDWIYVKVVVLIRKLQRVLQRT